jgi:signal transduction histidine kinase/CheY-like chemotaxis protein
MRPHALAAGIFALAIGVGVLLIRQAEELDRTTQRAAALNAASDAGFALEQELTRSLSATSAMAAMIRREGGIAGFGALAAELMPLYAGASSLVLAPGGVVREVWPPTAAKGLIGLDLLRESSRAGEARAALAARQLTLAGPFELKLGGLGMVGRLPVFLHAARGEERFWGFANVIVRLPDLLAASGIDRLGEAGYEWALTRVPRETGVRVAIAGSGGPLHEPVTMDVTVPNGEWTLAVAPRNGWKVSPVRKMGYPVTLAVAAALALLAFRVLRAPEVLRREVAARTADLAEANRALAADIAERKRTEEQLRQSQKMDAIGQLAGGVAHDFNNLLTGILGYASLLVETGAPESREAGRAILEAGQRAASLTRQLLGLARRGKLLNAPVDVHAIVDEVMRFLGRTLDRSIALERDLRARRAVVVGDAGQIHQILLNLAVNARDAMQGGGIMTFATEEVEAAAGEELAAGRYLAISVRDTGIGIPREIRERIFEPFFTTKPQGEGTGLGLATVYGIARNHGGTVTVASEPGNGSTFTVRLPLAGGALEPPGEREKAEVPRGHARVLVVDDEHAVRAVTSRMLGELGYRAVATGSARDALGEYRAARGSIDLVLLDMSMPEMDGLACLQALREVDPGVRVLVSSGYARDGRAQQMLDEGATGFVQKPFVLRELAEAVERALRHPKAAAGAYRASR